MRKGKPPLQITGVHFYTVFDAPEDQTVNTRADDHTSPPNPACTADVIGRNITTTTVKKKAPNSGLLLDCRVRFYSTFSAVKTRKKSRLDFYCWKTIYSKCAIFPASTKNRPISIENRKKILSGKIETRQSRRKTL
jgi:hypothetical protein